MSARAPLHDAFARPLRSLRVSVTDRCNLRCAYCMPERRYRWLPREDVLTLEEITTLVGAFCALGVEKVRLTGGEPLLRHGLPELVRMLSAQPGLRDLALTTNGIALASVAEALRAAGLSRLTVSLDTLRRDRFLALTQRDEIERTLGGIRAAREAGFRGTRLNTVVMRGVNDDELDDLLRFAQEHEVEPRFIEYMDVGGATDWSPERVVSRDEILARIVALRGPVTPLERAPEATAERFRTGDGQVFGVIASTTQPFCAGCDRARLTADGRCYTCLYARHGLDLRAPLRAGATREELAGIVAAAWRTRADRGAERRRELAGRGRLFDPEHLEAEPHLEMHVRGG